MNVTPAAKAELRRLHVEQVKAIEKVNSGHCFIDDHFIRDRLIEAFRVAAAESVIPLLDALAAAEADLAHREAQLKLTQEHLANAHKTIKQMEGERDRLLAGPLGKIAAERRRQVEEEGWTAEHDDGHAAGEMAEAAACYAAGKAVFHAVERVGTGYEPYASYEPLWPWDDAWWKPKDPISDLIRAGALIVAEMERREREAALGDAPCL